MTYFRPLKATTLCFYNRLQNESRSYSSWEIDFRHMYLLFCYYTRTLKHPHFMKKNVKNMKRAMLQFR